MREIKFRAWDITANEMKFIETREDFDYLAVAISHPNLYNVMQYTGLKDNQGKEIYEGDILKGKFNGSVVWTVDRYNDGWSDYWNESEIIGNIYENPKLLT